MNRLANVFALVALILSAVGIIYCIFVHETSVRYGFINTEKMLNTFVDAQKVRDQMLAEESKWNDAEKVIEDSLATFEERLKLEYDTASIETKKRLKSEQTHRMEELGRFEQAKKDGLQKMQSELMAPVYEKINGSLAEYAKEHGLDVVFASSNGSIVYGDGSRADLTEDFVLFLNNKYQ